MRIIIEVDDTLTPPQVSIRKAGKKGKALGGALTFSEVDAAAFTLAEDAGAAPGYADQPAPPALEALPQAEEATSAGAAPK